MVGIPCGRLMRNLAASAAMAANSVNISSQGESKSRYCTKDGSLLRGWTGRCMVAECGASLADGWTHDGCQACQDREKAKAGQ